MDVCPSCGAQLTGKYCSSCGQERVDPSRETVRGFVRASVAAVSPVDGRAVLSLRDLIRRPGLLTREFIAGRRQTYLPALQLFLLCNLVFFILSGVMGNRMFTQPLVSQTNMQIYSPLARDMVRDRMTGEGAPDYRELAARFDLVSDHYARALVIIMVPFIALAVGILEYGRGRALHHVVFALHYLSFALLFYIVEFVVFFRIGRAFGWFAPDSVFAITAFLAQAVYLAFAFRRAYGDGVIAAVAKGAVASFAAMVTIQIYRFILFMVAIHAA
ncbi:MAG TPA: DUF3667 domain-containing protein [Longimicrobiales bacterium]